MQAVAILKADWCDPVAALAPFAEEPFALMVLSGGGGERGRWSYLLREPSRTLSVAADDPRDPFEALAGLLGPLERAHPDGPPFQGGVAGLAAYELGARVEPVPLARDPDWPDLVCAAYPALLAFDHEVGEVVAVGRGETPAEADSRARFALSWLTQKPPSPLRGGVGVGGAYSQASSRHPHPPAPSPQGGGGGRRFP